MCRINGTPIEADAMEGGLDDDILLGVNSPADFMPLSRWYTELIPEATKLQTVLAPGGSAVKTRSQYMLVPDCDGPNMMTAAGGALSYH